MDYNYIMRLLKLAHEAGEKGIPFEEFHNAMIETVKECS